MRRSVLGFVLFALFLIGAPLSASADPLAFAKAADKAKEKGKLDQAIRLYTKAIEMGGLSPHNLAIIHFRRGESWSKKGNWYRAADDLGKAVRYVPGNLHFRIYYGSALLEKDEYEAAILQYERAISIDPTSVYPYSNLGGLWTHRGDYAKAEGYFNKARERDPKAFWLRRQIGEFYFCIGQFAQAEKEFKETIRLRPSDWGIHTTPLLIYLAQRKQGKAADRTLIQYAAKTKPDQWPGPAYSLFLEKITPSEFLANMQRPGGEQDNTIPIQVRMYLGYYYSLKGEQVKAVEMLRWYLDSAGKGTWGYLAALGELKRLTTAR